MRAVVPACKHMHDEHVALGLAYLHISSYTFPEFGCCRLWVPVCKHEHDELVASPVGHIHLRISLYA